MDNIQSDSTNQIAKWLRYQTRNQRFSHLEGVGSIPTLLDIISLSIQHFSVNICHNSTKTRSAHTNTLGAITTFVNLFSQHITYTNFHSLTFPFSKFISSQNFNRQSRVYALARSKNRESQEKLLKKNFHHYFESAKIKIVLKKFFSHVLLLMNWM